MNLKQFAQQTQLLTSPEIEKVKLLAFYHLKTLGRRDFMMSDVAMWFEELDLARPEVPPVFWTGS